MHGLVGLVGPRLFGCQALPCLESAAASWHCRVKKQLAVEPPLEGVAGASAGSLVGEARC